LPQWGPNNRKDIEMNTNDVASALLDMYDIRAALSTRIKNRPKDNEGSELTIGDCVEDVIYFLESLSEEQKP